MTSSQTKTKTNTKPSKTKPQVSQILASVPFTQFQLFVQEIHAISSQTDSIEVAHIVKDHTSDTLNCDRTSFYFVDGQFLDLVIAKGVDSIRMPKTTGFAGMCATSNDVVNIPDAYEDDRYNRKWDKINNYRTKQIICAPVFDAVENEVIGVLQCINKKTDSPFDNVDRELIMCIAQQVAVAIRYALQMEEAQQATAQKDALISYIRNMNANTNVPSLLFTLNKAAQELLEADRVTFYTIDHTMKTLHLINSDSSIEVKLKMSQGIAGAVATTAKQINIPDCYLDKRFDPSFDKISGYHTRSMLVMPVFADVASQRKKEKPIAVVQLINKAQGEAIFDIQDEEILTVLLRFVGPLIKNSHLFTSRTVKKEFEATQNLSLHAINRQPSREIKLSDLQSMAEFAEEEEEDPEWGTEPSYTNYNSNRRDNNALDEANEEEEEEAESSDDAEEEEDEENDDANEDANANDDQKNED